MQARRSKAARHLGTWIAAAWLAGVAQTGMAQDSSTARIPLTKFASMRWLAGRWVGSGGGYAAFYEEYRVLNDSTIEQREFPDSTFTTPGRASAIEWRNGVATKREGGRIRTRITRIAGDTTRFETAGGGGGFTWIRFTADQWRAVLDGRGTPIVYTLRRVSR